MSIKNIYRKRVIWQPLQYNIGNYTNAKYKHFFTGRINAVYYNHVKSVLQVIK